MLFIQRCALARLTANFYPELCKLIAMFDSLGDDAKHYQIHAVKRAVEESKS